LAACVALAVLGLSGCKPKNQAAPMPGASLRETAGASLRETAGAPRSDDRRLLFAQIVEDAEPNEFAESAVIEGQPFKYLLRSLAQVTQDGLRKRTNEAITFESLTTEPGMYRGQVVTLPRGVVIEVSQAQAPEDYGLPPGSTILPAIFIDAARDVYALRILCPPGSKLFERLDQGIRNDALPVARVTGCFMKLYARRTGDPKEPPWRKPLLICPELEFSQAAEPRKVWDDLKDSKADRLLPSERIPAPGAEERFVVEIAANGRVRADGKDARGDLKPFVAGAVAGFKARLPEDQRERPAAVILIAAGASRKPLDGVVGALRAAGVKRLAVKSELGQ
jgi:hypothetical protein